MSALHSKMILRWIKELGIKHETIFTFNVLPFLERERERVCEGERAREREREREKERVWVRGRGTERESQAGSMRTAEPTQHGARSHKPGIVT